MGKYKFRYRLTNKSSLASIAKAVRELGYNMNINKDGFYFFWEKNQTKVLSASHNTAISRMRKYQNGLMASLKTTTFWHQRSRNPNNFT